MTNVDYVALAASSAITESFETVAKNTIVGILIGASGNVPASHIQSTFSAGSVSVLCFVASTPDTIKKEAAVGTIEAAVETVEQALLEAINEWSCADDTVSAISAGHPTVIRLKEGVDLETNSPHLKFEANCAEGAFILAREVKGRQQESDGDGHDCHGCADVEGIQDVSGYTCRDWAGYDWYYYSAAEEYNDLINNCPVTYASCPPCTDASVISQDPCGVCRRGCSAPWQRPKWRPAASATVRSSVDA